MNDTNNARAAPLGGNIFWPLATITLMGLFLRIFYQAGRPFIGDEVGTLLHLHHSYRFLLRNFGDQWLTMNFYLVLMKGIASLFGAGSWVLSLPSILAGTAAIPLTAALASRFSSRRTALFAALLVGANPFLCHFSVQIRSYSLQILFGLAALVFLVDWLKLRSWANGVGFAAAACLATLMQINTMYTCIFFTILLMAHLFQSQPGSHARANLDSLPSILIPSLCCLVVLVVFYFPFFGSLRMYADQWTSERPTSISYIPEIMRTYFGRGFLLLPSLLLLCAGAWSSTQQQRKLLWLGLAILIHLVAPSLAGLSVLPWMYARFLIFMLPFLLIFAAEGIVCLTGSWRPSAGWILALIVVASWSPEFYRHEKAKQCNPWQEVARVLDKQRSAADLVLVMKTGLMNNAAMALLPYYMDRWQILTSAQEYCAVDKDSGQKGKLFIVNGGKRIQSDVPSHLIGDVQILAYHGETRKDIMRHIIADIQSTTQDKISREYTDLYDLLLAFSQGILTDEERRKYTILFYESFLRIGTILHQLPQFQSKPELFGPLQW